MKITLDLSKLVAEGRLTAAEADRLRGLAASETSALGINILVGFGVVAVSAGSVALVPTPFTGALMGAAMFGFGLYLMHRGGKGWELLAQICVVIGALMASIGIVVLGKITLSSLLLVTVALAIGSLIARSSLLMGFAVIALASCIGAQAGYSHASYSLAIYEPTVTIVVFGALAYAAFRASTQLPHDYERLAITASRVSVILVNFGFWVGSLWGDRLIMLRSLVQNDPNLADLSKTWSIVLPRWFFVIAWAAALLAVGIWGVKENRRWVVNVAAVFAAIHFYTQWFERLGPKPLAFFVGGVLMLAFALGLWRFNKSYEKS